MPEQDYLPPEAINSFEQKDTETRGAEMFVKSNIVPVKDGAQCVDGRYAFNGDDEGRLSRAGGDLGYAMAYAAVNRVYNLGLQPEDCFTAVYALVTQNGEPFRMHTDHHIHPDTESTQSELNDHEHNENDPCIGCGHAAKAADVLTAYPYLIGLAMEGPMDSEPTEVFAEDMKVIVKHGMNSSNRNVVVVNLEGDHDEAGVLRNKGFTRSVRHQDDTGKKYFVADIERDQKHVEEMAHTLLFDGNLPEGVNYLERQDVIKQRQKAFIDACEKHTMATLRYIAYGKPVYDFNADLDYPEVKKVGIVE